MKYLILAGMALSCVHDPPVKPPELVISSCARTEPPARTTWKIVKDCPPGLVCLTDSDAYTLAHELEDRRAWDERTWAACGGLDKP